MKCQRAEALILRVRVVPVYSSTTVRSKCHENYVLSTPPDKFLCGHKTVPNKTFRQISVSLWYYSA